MSNYMNYLEESTNVVKSNDKKSKIFVIVGYLVIWVIAIIAFRFFTDGSNALGFSLLYLWIILPLTTFIVSLLIGVNHFWGNKKWLASIVLGIMYMLAEYCTFSAANMIEFKKFYMPRLSMILGGVIISLIGLAVGHLIYYIQKKNRPKNSTIN